MNQRHILLQSIILLILASATARSQKDAPQTSSVATSALARVGVRFTENRGQVVDTRGERRPDILYTAGAGGMKLFFRRDGVSYVFQRWTPDPAIDRIDHSINPLLNRTAAGIDHDGPRGTMRTHRVDMQLVGANMRAEVRAEEPAGSYSNYYLPQCPDGITHVESYRRIIYRDVYPHIDLVFHGGEQGLKYDFVVRPGGRVADIRWRYVGSDGVAITKEGGLDIASSLGTIGEDVPYAYQEGMGEVPCAYSQSDGTYGFSASAYDVQRTLVIDPTVQWATFVGGSQGEFTGDRSSDIATDAAGNICAIFVTTSTDFPVSPGAMQGALAALGSDFGIIKLNGAGNLVWSTYWGGDGSDYSVRMRYDNAGNYAIAGVSMSSNFPVGPGAHQAAMAGVRDLVVGELDGNGRRRWGSYLGGTDVEDAPALAVDSSRNVVLCGNTRSGDFPLLSPSQGTNHGDVDVVVAKFTGTGTLRWSTYYGGSQGDIPNAIATAANGEILATGLTGSANLPMFGTPYQPAPSSATPIFDAFLLRMDPNGAPVWSTYYGGSGMDMGNAIAVDQTDAVIVTGATWSPNLPTNPSSAQRALSRSGAYTDCFVTKFSGTGQHIWSTYYGGTDNDLGLGLLLISDEILVVGYTISPDFPVTPNALQSSLKGTEDIFLAQFDGNGTQAKWSTYYGGGSSEYPGGISSAAGSIVVSGVTESPDLPMPASGFDPTYNGNHDGFIVKLDGFCPVAVPTIVASGPLVICDGDSISLDIGAGFTDIQWAPTNQTSRRITVKRSGTFSVTARDAGGCVSTSRAVDVRVRPKPTPVIAPSGPITLCQGDSVRLDAARREFVSYRWSSGDTVSAIWVKDPGLYFVRVVDTNGCDAQSPPVQVRVNPSPARPELSVLDTIRMCADSAMRLDAGAGYASYRWSSGESIRSIVPKQAGLYYVDVMNASGCVKRSDSVIVWFYPRSEVRLMVEGSADLCAGDSVVLRVPQGSFTNPRWSRRDTTDAITVKSSGLYYVTVTDSNGCRMRSDTVRVTAHPALNATITGPSTVCRNTTPTYGASSAGTLRYEWSISGDGTIQGASDGKSITVGWGASGGGTITLRITDTATGCVVIGTRNVTIGGELKPVIAPASITLCEGDSVELDAGSGYSTYAWSNGATSQMIWVKDTLGYSVEVVDPTGCRGRSDTVHARIEKKPAVVIDGAVKVCRSTTVTYSARDNSGASYQWTVSGGSITAGDSTSSITVQWGTGTAGVLRLRMTSASGCIGDTLISVEIGSELKPSIAASGPLNLCAPDSVELDAGAGYTSYLWSPGGETSQKITVSTAGIYSVTVQDASGCGGTSDPVQVTINQPPSVVITPSGPLKLKPKESIMLDAGAGYASYLWSTGATTRQIVGIDTGSYSVTVTDGNGCRATATVHVDLDDTRSGGRAELTLGTVSASPGERVEVPLLLVSSDSLGSSGASGYTARIRYRASLLEPVDATPRGAFDGDDRVISLSGELPSGMTSGELGRLAFMAAMGDSEAIPLKLEEVLWRDVSGSPLSIATTLHDGSFTLTGLCTNGGVRLVSTGGAVSLKIIGSNPVHDQLDVEYELIESGHHDLILYDILGREAGRLLSADLLPGNGTARREARDLPDGLYLLVLRTPTARLTLPVRVVR